MLMMRRRRGRRGPWDIVCMLVAIKRVEEESGKGWIVVLRK